MSSSKPLFDVKDFFSTLEPIEKTILLSLILHPGWMSLAFLKSTSSVPEAQVEQALQKFESLKYIRKSKEAPYYWQWDLPESSEAFLSLATQQEILSIHQKLFNYIRSLPNVLSYMDMLLFHALRGALKTWAFCYSLLLAEACVEDNALEEGLELFEQARSFAETPFKQVYLESEIASLLFRLGKLDQAAEAWTQALGKAESISWTPLAVTCALSLANLYSHEGCFSLAENFYRRSLSFFDESSDPHLERQTQQNLASSLIEQGRYNEALEILTKLSQIEESSSFEKVAIGMHQVRVYNALGNFTKARSHLEVIEEKILEGQLERLKPYIGFLRGRFELAQGHFVEAFRYLGEAAHGFEEADDLPGKIDVLLALSSVLLENSLLREAHQLVGEISAWQELAAYPALEQAIRLRRLTLSAFSGQWVQNDIDLLNPQAEKTGRQEDWLQFWFHLGLAALRIDNDKLADSFFKRAKNILDRITARLSAEQLAGFRQRPEIARLFRLLEKDNSPLSETQAVRADQAALDFHEAPEATLAPPISNRPRS